jgi:hypothetical protein
MIVEDSVMSSENKASEAPVVKKASASANPAVRRLFELADQHEFAAPAEQEVILDEFIDTLVGK